VQEDGEMAVRRLSLEAVAHGPDGDDALGGARIAFDL
jgi:hypothetical protein